MLSAEKTAAARPRKVFFSFSAGFVLVFNVYLVFIPVQNVRLSDFVSVIATIFIFYKLLTSSLTAGAALRVCAAALLPSWIFIFALTEGYAETVALIGRWYLALGYGFLLADLARDEEQRVLIVKGIWWGCVANVAILLIEGAGFVDQLASMGMYKTDGRGTWIDGIQRMAGLHGHPNGTMAIVSVSVWCAAFLYLSGRWSWRAVGTSFLLVLLSSSLTLSRGPLLVLSLGMIVVAFAWIKHKRTLDYRSVLAISAIFYSSMMWLIVVGPPGGWERWTDSTNLSSNSGIRLTTMLYGLEISMTNIFGITFEAGRLLVNSVNISSYELLSFHNTFIQLSVAAGIPFAFWFYWRLFDSAFNWTRGEGSSGVFYLVFGCNFFLSLQFEERFGNPFFLIFAAWLILMPVQTRPSGKCLEPQFVKAAHV